MAIVSATPDRLAQWAAEPVRPVERPTLQVSSNPARRVESEEGSTRDGGPQATPLSLVGSGMAGTGLDGVAPATHRRRSRWFELNPGCFARAALLAGGVAGVMATAAGLLWMRRWVRRGRRVLRVVRTVRQAEQRLRGRR